MLDLWWKRSRLHRHFDLAALAVFLVRNCNCNFAKNDAPVSSPFSAASVNTALGTGVSSNVYPQNLPNKETSEHAFTSIFTARTGSLLSQFAFAVPPLICHAIEIGQAKTVPWVDLNFHTGTQATTM